MGFDCLVCGERDIWANESSKPRICKDCAGEKTSYQTCPYLTKEENGSSSSSSSSSSIGGLMVHPFSFNNPSMTTTTTISMTGNIRIGTFIHVTNSL